LSISRKKKDDLNGCSCNVFSKRNPRTLISQIRWFFAIFFLDMDKKNVFCSRLILFLFDFYSIFILFYIDKARASKFLDDADRFMHHHWRLLLFMQVYSTEIFAKVRKILKIQQFVKFEVWKSFYIPFLISK